MCHSAITPIFIRLLPAMQPESSGMWWSFTTRKCGVDSREKATRLMCASQAPFFPSFLFFKILSLLDAHVRVHTHTHTHTHIISHPPTHTHTHTHTHTRTHIISHPPMHAHTYVILVPPGIERARGRCFSSTLIHCVQSPMSFSLAGTNFFPCLHLRSI